ncbi:hypothetical protein B0H12DRAFT_1320847 [Mycena haematopus]|nr:hypothetical protein B0H12DRAFT_1320847 [Mycena haematopus]
MPNHPDPAGILEEIKRVNLDGLVVPKEDEEQLCELYDCLITEDGESPEEVEAAIKIYLEDLHQLYLAAKAVMAAAARTGIEFPPGLLDLDAD